MKGGELLEARADASGLNVVRLWRTDGTPAGTGPALDLELSAPGSHPLIFPRRGGGALMLAWDGKSRRLWRTDGTPRGTIRIGGLALAPELDAVDANPLQIGPLQFFGVTRQRGKDPDNLRQSYEIWRTDGTTRGTFRLLDLDGERFFWDLPASWKGRFLFEVEDAGKCAFWASDGTPRKGTRLLRDIVPGPGESSPAELIAAGGRVFFSAHDGVHGWELWESNGTPEGTRMVADLRPGMPSSAPTSLAVSGSTLYFSADDGIAGREPWVLWLP